MKKAFKYGFLILAGIILILFALQGNITHQKFHPEKWKNWAESEAEMSLRWEMMNSLRNRHELKGNTKNEIIQLLGEPESKTNTEFRYYLGFSKRGINTGSLIFKFNEKGIVTNFLVWQG